MNIANSFFSQINGIYLQLRSKKNIYSELNDIINQMLPLVEGSTGEMKVENIRNETRAFYPPNDDKFPRFIDLVLINLLIELSDEIPKSISNELNNKSNILLASLEKKINENKHLTEIQMSLIEKGHIYNLKKEFFHIVGEISQYKYVEYYYEKNLNILNKQIIDDKSQIQQYFNRFRANLNKKETVIEQKYDESVMKGTNYVMREVQKTREIEVIVAEDGDINTEIEQDF